MQLRHLKAFIAVADTLNVTRAAERIHLSQSSVTEQIQALETDLGVKLFDRSRRKLVLTPAGQRLLSYAVELIDLADEAYSAVAGISATVSGNLVIGGLETLCSTRLPDLIAEFGRQYPSVSIMLKTADSGGLRSGIGNGDLDVAFVFGDPPQASGMRGEVVGEENLRVILPPNHRLTGHATVTPEDLLDEVFVVTQLGCIYRKMFDEAFEATLPERPKRVGDFASIGSILGLVEAGAGCALVPASALTARSARLISLPWAGKSRTTPIAMMWRRRRIQSPATGAFLSVAQEYFQTRR